MMASSMPLWWHLYLLFIKRMKKNTKIIKKLINESFPKLKDKKIHVFVLGFRYYACSIWLPPFIRFIAISKRSRKLNDYTLKGLLAHELCHQERYLKMGIINYLKLAFKFFIFKKARDYEENAADELAIKKGYAKQLYQLSKIKHRDRKHKDINKFYLSLKQIKSHAKKTNKW